MRLLLALLLVGTASANPKPDAKKPTKAEAEAEVAALLGPKRGVEPAPSVDYDQHGVTKSPSFGGGNSLGIVTEPPWHSDMRPYAEGGMVIRPPWTGDNMVIAPGGDGLPSGHSRLFAIMKYGADKLFETLIPSAGGT